MASRKQSHKRKTKETDILLELDPDAAGEIRVDTGVPFLNHLLEALAFHGGFSLSVRAKGDLEVDPHHLVEDTGLALGEALAGVLEASPALERFGHAVICMDDALSEASVDVCGRPFLVYRGQFPQPRAGDFDLALIREFLGALAGRARINLHAELRYGTNSHHMAEALFKALGKALRQAYSRAGSQGLLEKSPSAMSAKGTISD